MPRSFLVKNCAHGMRILSYNGIRMIIETVMAAWRVAGGTLNLGPIFRFIVTPCLVKNVAGCWKITANSSNMVHIGKSLSVILTLSEKHMPLLGLSLTSLLFTSF